MAKKAVNEEKNRSNPLDFPQCRNEHNGKSTVQLAYSEVSERALPRRFVLALGSAGGRKPFDRRNHLTRPFGMDRTIVRFDDAVRPFGIKPRNEPAVPIAERQNQLVSIAEFPPARHARGHRRFDPADFFQRILYELRFKIQLVAVTDMLQLTSAALAEHAANGTNALFGGSMQFLDPAVRYAPLYRQNTDKRLFPQIKPRREHRNVPASRNTFAVGSESLAYERKQIVFFHPLSPLRKNPLRKTEKAGCVELRDYLRPLPPRGPPIGGRGPRGPPIGGRGPPNGPRNIGGLCIMGRGGGGGMKGLPSSLLPRIRCGFPNGLIQ